MSTAQAVRLEDLDARRARAAADARQRERLERAGNDAQPGGVRGTDEHLNRTVDALQLIGGSRPLRAIVTVPTDGATTAEVSSTCWRNVSGHEVRSEQIVVRRAAGGAAPAPWCRC